MTERVSDVDGLQLHFEQSEESATLAGQIRGSASVQLCAGGSLLFQHPETGAVHEGFIDSNGRFSVRLDTPPVGCMSIVACAVSGAKVARFSAFFGDDTSESNELPKNVELSPPWPQFALLVRQCLLLAGEVADRTGRNRDEMFAQVYSQERYAERAYREGNAKLYDECWHNLHALLTYLERLQPDSDPGDGGSIGATGLPAAANPNRRT